MTRGDRERKKTYWREFYKQQHSLVPSQFCALVASEIDSHATIVDWGSGNGRDALFFSTQGHTTIAMDLSMEAVKVGDHESVFRGLHDKVLFLQGDLSSRADVQNIVRIARAKNSCYSLVSYCRFVLHSLDEAEEDRFLSALSACMNQNEYVFFEFRSKEDANRKKHYPIHFRRYLDTEIFQQNLKYNWGFSVEYSVTGIGMAKYKEEDPIVTRIYAKKIDDYIALENKKPADG